MGRTDGVSVYRLSQCDDLGAGPVPGPLNLKFDCTSKSPGCTSDYFCLDPTQCPLSRCILRTIACTSSVPSPRKPVMPPRSDSLCCNATLLVCHHHREAQENGQKSSPLPISSNLGSLMPWLRLAKPTVLSPPSAWSHLWWLQSSYQTLLPRVPLL